MTVPALAKVLSVFAAMLLLTRSKVPLSLSLILGGIGLCLWSPLGPGGTAPALGHALVAPDLWMLIAVTACIIELGRYITCKGNAEHIIAATRRWGGRHGRAVSLIALPAMIGLIPMPAGALFSAPFVEQAGSRVKGAGAWKAAVNYWFRHVWEYWWPLYPGVILTVAIFDMPTWLFTLVQAPFTLVAVGAGYFFLIRPHIASLADDSGPSETIDTSRARFLAVPLLLVVVTACFLPAFLAPILPNMGANMRKLLSVLAGLFAALLLAFLDEHRRRRLEPERDYRFFVSLLSRKSLGILLTLGGVMVFKSMLGESGLLPLASRELIESSVPVVVAVAVLPFLGGLVTGLALGFSGTAFPLVAGLLAVEGSTLTPLATLVLAYGFGYMGMMLSPIHLCLLVTREYFGTTLSAMYRQTMPCAVSLLVYAVLLHVILAAAGL